MPPYGTRCIRYRNDGVSTCGHFIFAVNGVIGGAPPPLRPCDAHNEPAGPGALQVSDGCSKLLPASRQNRTHSDIEISEFNRLGSMLRVPSLQKFENSLTMWVV